MLKNKATFGDLHKLQALNKTLKRFDCRLELIYEEKRKDLINWLQKWSPRNNG